MPATITYSGTPTGLATNLAQYEDAAQPAHLTLQMHPDDLQSPPDEIRQIIDTCQRMWGAQIGSGKRVDFSVTVRMLLLLLQSYIQQGLPRSGDRAA
jgi:deoxyribodipyrimidine photolyase-like uncharacterized protein